MKAPLITAQIGNWMNDKFEAACHAPTLPKAFIEGLKLGIVDGAICALTTIGATVVTIGGIGMLAELFNKED